MRSVLSATFVLLMMTRRSRPWERFGLPGLGTVILIDPEGKLVEGDETELAEKLNGK